MPHVLNLPAQEFQSNEQRAKYTVGIVGCGKKGVFYANSFAEIGFKVLCTDADVSIVKKIARGKTAFCEPELDAKLKSYITSGQISVTSDLKKALQQSDVIIIAFGPKIDDKNKADIAQTINACKQVGAVLQQGVLVVYGGLAGLGFTEGTIKETLENTSGLKVGKDFGLAYNSILGTIPSGAQNMVVAANDLTSLKAAAAILKVIAPNLIEVGDIKTAETLTLFAVAKKDVNTALANELATFCESANVDFFKVLRHLASNDATFAAQITEEENKEGYLLLESADNLNAKVRLPALARQINEDMVKHAVNLTQEALRSWDKTLRRARVAVFGPANQACSVFVKHLEQKGAKVVIYDPAAKKEISDVLAVKTSLNETVEGADCIIILSNQERFNNLNLKKLKPLMKAQPILVDLIGRFDPVEVKTEGFLYCGLGRETR